MRPDTYPLSPIQEGMLFHWLLDPHSGTDVEQIVADLHEPVDPARLERSWQHAVDAFGTLRTAFAWEGLASPVQYVVPQANVPFAFEDLRRLDDDARSNRLEQHLREDRRAGFNLAAAPAMRVSLLQIGDSRFRMVWTFHHILIDGRSFETILDRVFGAYDGVASGETSERPYREYIDWVVAQNSAPSREFWRRKLAGFTATTPLPHATGRDAVGAPFAEARAALSVETTARLRELAARENLSLNSLVIAAWALLLARHSGEADVVFGVTKTTRRGTIPDADAIVGLFLATIPVRITVDAEMSVRDWLRRVREEWVSLRGHEHLSLVEIKQLSELPASAPLFDSFLMFENYELGALLRSKGGAWRRRSFTLLEQPGYPLALMAYGDDAMSLKIDYDARRFDAETVDRLLGHLSTVLGAWSERIDGPVWRVPMLTAPERSTVLEKWNATAMDYPRDVPLASLLEAQVERTPNAIAVVHGDERITYRDLNARANQLARELVKHGAGPDTIVGLCVERSLAMMIALLAIVKAGAAYLPIDPFLPADRVSYMLSDSGLVALITQERIRSSLPAFDGPIISVDGALDGAAWTSHSAANLDIVVRPEHLGYVIYTSGSTGKPKGVELSRGSLLNLLWSMREWLDLGAADRLLAVTTISFDIASADIWLPWLVGAQTILASREQAADGEQLRQLIERHDVTFLQATPITWRLLLGAGWQGKQDMQIVCTGEAMPPELSRQLTPIVRRLWNLYGPTETTIWSTGYRVERGDEPILIGRPVGNTQCYILDAHLQPVPLGATGELYIAGDGLARGYLKRPDLTAEKFVSDPFRAGQRMYRTGDLARYHADGNIECLGRTDHQVKIRGFRIELGEIESVLKQQHDVREAIVIAREDTPGDKRLVAYVISRDGALDPARLRTALKASLPDYMVPAAFVQLDTMPMTPSGKVDRRALPAPAAGVVSSERVVVAPRTYFEQQLAEIWEEVFELSPIGVDDSFWDLGGHSMLAVKLMSRITKAFGKRVPLNTLFEAPTVAQLSKHIEDDSNVQGRHTIVPIRASGSKPPVYWIPGGAALGLFSLKHIVPGLGSEQPVYGLGSAFPNTVADIEKVEERAAQYLTLIRRVQPHGPYFFAGYCAGGMVAFEMAQQLLHDNEEVAFLGMINCLLPRHPSGAMDTLRFKAQRLRYQLRQSRSDGRSLVEYIRDKRSARRAHRAERQQIASAVEQAKREGFKDTGNRDYRVVLDATADVISQYQPRFYPGTVALFVSDDPSLRGVSSDLDPRFAWTRYAARRDVYVCEGDHESVLELPHALDLAGRLKEAIDAAADRAAGNGSRVGA
ncbi:MAG: non-ribosomal peptide synthetase [Deltaproteobacteria bacterium]